jgi:WXG100 family type VII secretion target
MTAEDIQIDYTGMGQIARSFERAAADTQQTLLRVRRYVDSLQSGGWNGRGAAAFFAEMDQEVLPSVDRLQKALREAQRVTLQVARDMRQAEEEAANVFRNGTAVAGAGGPGAIGMGGGLGAIGVGAGAGIAANSIGAATGGGAGGGFWDGLGWKNEGDIYEVDLKKPSGERGGFDLGLQLRYGVENKSVWGDLEKDGYAILGGSGGLEVGFDGKFDAGLSGELYAAKGKLDGVLAGDDNLGLTGGIGGNVLKGEYLIGLKDNNVGVAIGGTLVSVEGEVGTNVAGVNVGLTGELGLKLEYGFIVGPEKGEVKLPFFSVGYSFGKAKR